MDIVFEEERVCHSTKSCSCLSTAHWCNFGLFFLLRLTILGQNTVQPYARNVSSPH
ncbi:hypothetical protein LZ31DRAFT_551808 [Colletotrichum somersetense]|nr:hypothetical protein LZ31DRAFT_551808 [Colletotrichum somersetense]